MGLTETSVVLASAFDLLWLDALTWGRWPLSERRWPRHPRTPQSSRFVYLGDQVATELNVGDAILDGEGIAELVRHARCWIG
jgi:hypothetical protein